MAKVWKILALLLVITALVWLTTMWRWQSSRFDPSPADLTLNLAVLPLVLTGALVLLVWGVTRLRTYAAAPARPPTPLTAVATPASSGETSERSAHFRVLSSAVQVRAGTSWADAQASISSGDCKPDLDPALKDDDGMPVFTAAMTGVSPDAVADAVAELLSRLAATKPEAWAGFDMPTEALRSLALLQHTLADIAEALEAQWPVLSAPPPSARAKTAQAPALPPTVALRVAVPARWSPQVQQVAKAWLEQQLEPLIDAGLKAAGQSRAMAHSVRPAVQSHVHPVSHAEAFWLLMDQQLVQWQRDKEPGLLLALAADSLIGEDELLSMATKQELFSGSNQNGRVPGEGAAALLLASPAWPAAAEADAPQAHMYRACMMQRDKSADGAGRISPQTLQQAAGDALKGSAWPIEQIQHLSSDADHRGSRTGEVFETLHELLPHLDPAVQALRLGVGCGDIGIARLLACAALTAERVKTSQAGALMLAAFPAFERLAVVITPALAPPAPPAAQAAAAT